MRGFLTPDQLRRTGRLNPFVGAKYEHKASGYWIVDGVEVAATIQCCHCGMHYVSIRGSGKTRGFCMGCMRPTCGKKQCDPCLAFEKRVDLLEKGKIKSLF